jgi:hypothetical protein
MAMPSNSPRKPKLLLNFVLALLVIAFAFALDTYHKRLKAEEKAAGTHTAQDSSVVKDSAAAADTADTASDAVIN